MKITTFIFLVLAVVALFIFKRFVDRLFRRKYEYLKKEYLMTQPERDCFNSLVKAVGEAYWIFPQIHFSAFLDTHIVGQHWDGAFWHINGKSVDYILCTKERLVPVLAIELDDRSHDRSDRQERDQEEERMFKSAKMPLLRLQHTDIDDVAMLHKKVSDALLAPVDAPEEKKGWLRKVVSFFVG